MSGTPKSGLPDLSAVIPAWAKERPTDAALAAAIACLLVGLKTMGVVILVAALSLRLLNRD